MKTYPLNLVLENRLVILIGAKGEIVHKIAGLLEVGAIVRVIAPTADAEVMYYALEEQIEWIARPYQHGDLAGAVLTIANTGHAEVHDAVWAEGAANGQLVNIMDVMHQCNFHNASVVRRGQLTISVGTGGASPALAVTLRKRFEKEFGEEYAIFLEHARALRPEVARRLPTFRRRADFWYDLIESNAFKLLHEENMTAFTTLMYTLLEKHAAKNEANNLVAVAA